MCFTQSRGEQEWTEFGISLDPFTPISDWQYHQLLAGPAHEKRLGNTTRMFANNRPRTVTRKGVQGPRTSGGVGSARKHTCGGTRNSVHAPAGPPFPSDRMGTAMKPPAQQQCQQLLESNRKPSFARRLWA